MVVESLDLEECHLPSATTVLPSQSCIGSLRLPPQPLITQPAKPLLGKDRDQRMRKCIERRRVGGKRGEGETGGKIKETEEREPGNIKMGQTWKELATPGQQGSPNPSQ